MEPYLIIAIVTASLAVAALAISYVCYRMAFRRKNDDENDFFSFDDGVLKPHAEHIRSMKAELDSYPHESVEITSRDGVRLCAEFYPVEGADMTEIQFHGYRSAAKRDFACGGCEAIRKKHNLLLVDQRAHGKSGGKTISFGIKERFDALDWIDYLCQRLGKDTEILLFGVSMGAATVLMASEFDLPDNVCCVVADCSYSSPEAIIKSVIRDMHLPPSLAFPFVRLGGLIFGSFDVSSASPVEAVKHTKAPTMIIHGEADSFVPYEMGCEIYSSLAAKKREMHSFPGADHGTSYLSDRERYLGEVKRFTEESRGERT